MAAASTHRSRSRSCAITFRLTPEERAEVNRRAHAAGVSMQTYLERIILDRPDAKDLPPGPQRNTQEALPLTG